MKWVFALLLTLLPALVAAEPVTVTSPDSSIVVALDLNSEGRASYAVTRSGKPIIAESQLGFLFTDAPQMLRNFRIERSERTSLDQSWQQPWGEWKIIRDKHNELRVTLKETSVRARTLIVTFRVFDNGVGFRYEFPDQPNLKTTNIAEELTQFAIAQPATAWWAPAFESNREEYLYNRTPVAEIGIAQTPLTMKLADGTHISIHEAALVDYAGMNVAKVEGGLLKAVLTPGAGAPKVVRNGAFTTPWRVILIAPDAAGLYMANPVILNLNEPNKLGDVSWVKPRKYAGIWWGMHLETQSWASGPKHGATTANTRAVIDFAAANNMGGVLVEGWNKGWDGDWFANGEDFSFTQPYPDFDLEGLQKYARSKGVTLIGHHETSANAAHYETQMDAAFALDQRLGIDAVKTGYVSDAGGMKFKGADGTIIYGWHEGQLSAQHHLRVVEAAARHHVAIDAHEPIKDTGLRRTYPNWVSREGQRGMEYNAWGVPKNPPNWEAELVFTRMLGGPMDFTPGVLSLKGRGGTDILSTAAKQLATYVVVYSPIQMAADLPENYAKYPELMPFIRAVPTDWADTRVLAGEIGKFAVIARKDRASDDWYIGAVGGIEGSKPEFALDFLDPGRRYTATIWHDGEGADCRTEGRHNVIVETRSVKRGDPMAFGIAPGGGYAVRIAAGKARK